VWNQLISEELKGLVGFKPQNWAHTLGLTQKASTLTAQKKQQQQQGNGLAKAINITPYERTGSEVK